MIRANFICKRCGHKFTMEIFEKGEQEEKRLSGSPVKCPNCGSSSVERR